MSFTPPTYAWQLTYENGDTFSSEEGEPWESPVAGVVLLAQPGKDQDILASRDHLIYREDAGRWMEVDLAGFLDQQATYGRFITCSRVTRQMPSRTEFRALYSRMVIEVRGK